MGKSLPYNLTKSAECWIPPFLICTSLPPFSTAHRRAVCFLGSPEDWAAGGSRKPGSPRMGLETQRPSGKVVTAVGPAVDWKPLSPLCHLWAAGLFSCGSCFFRTGCWLQLYFVCFYFLFIKTIASTSYFPALCGDGALNLCLEKHNDFHPLLHAGPTTLWCQHSVIFCLFDHSSFHSVVFVPLVIQDFLFRVDLESFALSVPPLLFEPSTLGKVTQKSFAWGISLPNG